jgi:hypothetical protein
MVFSEDFEDYWENVAKNTALKCCPMYNIIKDGAERKISLAEAKTRTMLLSMEYNDMNIQMIIADVIEYTDVAIETEEISKCIIDIYKKILFVLNDPDYWKKVWKNDTSSEEARDLIIFKEAMKTLCKDIRTGISDGEIAINWPIGTSKNEERLAVECMFNFDSIEDLKKELKKINPDMKVQRCNFKTGILTDF